jgi:hypothetical protein
VLDDVPVSVATVAGLVLQQGTSGGGTVGCYIGFYGTVKKKDATACLGFGGMCEELRR